MLFIELLDSKENVTKMSCQVVTFKCDYQWFIAQRLTIHKDMSHTAFNISSIIKLINYRLNKGQIATSRVFYLDVSTWYFILDEMTRAYSIKYFLVKNSENTHPPIMILYYWYLTTYPLIDMVY